MPLVGPDPYWDGRKTQIIHQVPRITPSLRGGEEYGTGVGAKGIREDSSTFKVDSQAGKPPLSALEFVWPNTRNMKRAWGEENTPWVSYLGWR